jgi:hypothetical protein
MMPDMSRAGKEAVETGAGSGPGRWWVLPLLAVALALYVLWMGQGLAFHNQHGTYWFFLAPWWTNTSVKFIAMSAVLAAVIFWGGARLRLWMPWVLAALLLGGQLLCARAAWGVLRGTVPWGFDHPSFMFRLKEFGDLFPFALGGYGPWWNAGTEHFAAVTSGAHGFGMLILPLLKIWDPHVFYGAALVFWFVFGFPWLGVAAVRSAGVGRTGALCAGILMCGASREEFMWMWHFGTVGAMTSAMLALPATALGYRLAVLRRGGLGTALALGISVWLMCLWTPGVFIGAGLALGWLWNAREWTWRSNRWLVGAGVLALVLLSPWLWTTLFPCQNVVRYVGTVMEQPALGTMALNGAKRLLCALQEMHPVLAVLGVLGTLLAVPRELRRWMLPLFLVIGGIGGWSHEWKPLSQLDRMVIPWAVVAVFPAAALCDRLFGGNEEDAARKRWQAWLWALAQGIVLMTFLMGFRAVKMHYANQGVAPLRTMPPEMLEFAEWIHAEVPAEGRLGFAGRAVHFYGGGNIAYLPVLTGREMMADDYYGFPPGTIEYNYPPSAYRKDIDRYVFFSRAYGITHWVATMPDALEFLASHPDRFELAKSLKMLGRRIEVYRVKDLGPVSRFWEGAGRVVAKENRLEIFPADPAAARVVIRYNWRDGLFCRTPGASIESFAVDENLRFIAVHPGGNARVEIGYRPHAAPIQPNFDGTFHH